MFSEPVYKIFRPFEWDSFQASGSFLGSADDLRDGFIHLCTRGQMQGVLERYFSNEDTVVISTILFGQAAALNLKWEKGKDGAYYPHYYSNLQSEHVHSHVPAYQEGSGGIQMPRDIFFTKSVL